MRFRILLNADIACSVTSDGTILGVKGPSVHVDSTSLKPAELAFRTHAKKVHWGAGVGLSQGNRSLPADKVRESATSSGQADRGQSVNPMGQWTVT